MLIPASLDPFDVTPEARDRCERARMAFFDLVKQLDLPTCPETDIALARLQETFFWVTLSYTVNGKKG